MPSVFAKLNLKDQASMVIVNAPASFEPELAALRGVAIQRDLKASAEPEFALTFVTTQKEVDTAAKLLAKKAKGDAVVWLAYPKKSSKKYQSQINRDSGWQAMGDAGFEPVRMVAIDEDWSAVRFRRAEFIKTMKRGQEWRMSAAAKARA